MKRTLHNLARQSEFDSFGGRKWLAGVLLGGLVCAGTASGQTYTYATPYAFSTIAGSYGNTGTKDGTNGAAQFTAPAGLALDAAGNIYVADSYQNTIRKVTPQGTNWVVTTIIPGPGGSSDGTNGTAQFNAPTGIVKDSGNNLYVADYNNNSIRRITQSGTNWVVTTIAGVSGSFGGNFADGTNSTAQFYFPAGITLDGSGNLYVADSGNNAIRKLKPVGTNWVVTTIAGTGGYLNYGFNDGTNGDAIFNNPSAVAVDTNGVVFVADTGNNAIRRIAPQGTNWVTTTIAGSALNAGWTDGSNGTSLFFGPAGVAVDTNDNVYVTDSNNGIIRKISPVGTNWVSTTLAGWPYAASVDSAGTGTNAAFGTPAGIAVDASKRVFVGDTGSNDIREGTNAPPPRFSTWVAGNLLGASWPSSGGFTLQTNISLNPAYATNWGNYTGSVNVTNAISSITVTSKAPATLFFRLKD